MPIVCESLTHTYMPDSPFQATAIHGVDLTVGDGDFLGLIGHTGSGKTTLVMHFNALLKPTSGRVLVDGKDINEKDFDRREIRRRVGLVFQYPEHQLFEETVAKDVGFGPKNLDLSEAEIGESARISARESDWAAISALFMMLTLSPCEGFLPVYLSGVQFGWRGFVLLSAILAVGALAGMLLFTWLTLRGLQRINLKKFERWEAGLTGALFIALGVLFVVIESFR